MTDIVEQLRLLKTGAAWVCGETAATLEDAADEIERLRAERNLERSIFNTALRRAQAAEAERDRLREALRNLLADTQHARHNCGDPDCPVDAARAALKETGHE